MTKELTQAELRSALQQSVVVIQRLKKELAGYHEPIAVIGMACRFPGAASPEALWELLCQGVDQVTAVPSERWDMNAYYAATPGTPGKSYVREGAFLDKIDQFDPQFFNISPREAIKMDPQHRLLLEVSWEALERAGQSPAALQNSQTGVFVGVTPSEYTTLMGDLERADTYTSTGNFAIFASGRLSYTLGLQGPNLVIDTACSASLIGVHLACESLRAGSSDLALAGGVHLMLSPQGYVSMSQMHALSPAGRCKTFDAAADGFGRGEGCGLVVLKRLSAALADQDPILAVIRGSAINHDGPSSGLTVPSATAQAALIHRALENGKVAAHEVNYMEAHGTGTSLGDPLEVRALAAVFGQRTTPLLVGSVKTNIGHLEEAAGVASLIKVILAMQYAEIPPHLHLHDPNPHIDWENIAIRVPTQRTPWPRPEGSHKKVAGVSSFGMGGSNAHVVVEEAPVREEAANPEERPWHLLTLSAKSEPALRALVQRYCDFLPHQPATSLGDLCYTAYTGRSHFVHRLSVATTSVTQMQADLAAYAKGALPTSINQASVTAPQLGLKIAFLFTGQGAQYVNMGRELYETQPTFRATFDRCEAILREHLGESLLTVLYPDRETGRQGDRETRRQGDREIERLGDWVADESKIVNQTAYAQPALFALEYALATLWQAWGIQPTVVLGHSVGELVAACVAGVFSLEDGLKLVAARGRLMQALPQDGLMVSLAANEARVQAALAPYRATVSIAAVNGPESVVISGQRAAVLAIAEQLAAEGIKTHKLTVSHAFHSPLMEPMLNDFRQVAGAIRYTPPKRSLLSNVTGKLAADEVATPDYWVRHVRRAVRFADGVATLQEQGIGFLLEIGPKPVLLGMVGHVLNKVTKPVLSAPGSGCLLGAPLGAKGWQSDKVLESDPVTQSPSHPVLLPSLRPERSDWQQMLESLGKLYVHGVEIDWQGFDQGYARRKVLLPTYPFQRQRYWIDPPNREQVGERVRSEGLRPLIDKKTQLPAKNLTIFEKTFSTETLPFLTDHRVYGLVVAPGACYLALALSGAELLFKATSYALEHVIFPQPLALLDGDVRTVQLIAEAKEERKPKTTFAFQIVSFTEREADASESLTHATGQITLVHQAPPSVSWNALQARCRTAILPNDFYDAARAHNIVFGPSFRWLAAVWRGEEKEALARLQMPTAIVSTQGYARLPSLIDACFQLVGVVALTGTEETSGRQPLLPFAVESLVFYGPSSDDDLWCHAVEVGEKTWNLTLFTAAGQTIAQIRGFQMRVASSSAIQGTQIRPDWLYAIDWIPSPLPSVEKLFQRPAAWLIFGDESGVGAALSERLSTDGTPVYLTMLDTTFTLPSLNGEQGLQRATVAPLRPETFRQLLAVVAERHPSLGVVYLCSLDEITPDDNLPAETVQQCGRLLHLMQALVDTKITARLWLATQACQPVAEEQTLFSPAAGALWGLGRTIALELPNLRCVCIDLPEAASTTNAAHLYEELLSGWRLTDDELEGQVAYRKGVRYGARLTHWQAPVTGQAAAQAESTKIAEDATYLITGGTGALGLQAAQQLAEAGARHLVLTSRSGVTTAEARAAIGQLEENGVDIQVVQADVGELVDVQRVLGHCGHIAPLRGIIHAAGVVEDGVIAQQSLDRFAKVMRPKVYGAWHLHRLTQAMKLDLFVCFSSAASMLGSPGQSNYAAANAFMDTLMQQRSRSGQSGLSIHWGPWADIGLAAALETRLSAQGMLMIPPVQGNAYFRFLLDQGQGCVGVLSLNHHRFVGRAGVTFGPGYTTFYARLLPAGRTQQTQSFTFNRPALQAAAPAQRAVLVMDYLRGLVAGITGIPATEVDLQQPLLALGVDSLMAVELRNRITEDAGITIPVSLFLDTSAISALANQIVTHLAEVVASSHPAPHRTGDALAVETAVATLAQHQNGQQSKDHHPNEMSEKHAVLAVPASGPQPELEGEL